MNRTAIAMTSGAAAALIIGAVFFLASGPGPANSNQAVQPGNFVNANTNAETPCDPTLWDHVYPGDPKRFGKPQDRLQVITDCVTVTGTLYSSKPEADGDLHIRVTLDPQFQDMLNAKNMTGQRGKLVIEPVCQNEPTQADTISEASCSGYHQPLTIPPVGTRVSVTGVYVTDMEHGWNELHPVSNITEIK